MSKRSRRDSISSSPSDQSYDALSPSSRAPSTPPPSKLPQLDWTSDNDNDDGHPSSSTDVMRCSLPPHKETLSFASYDEYEVHYVQAHVNRCAECGKNFPTELFLNLHIEENHDALVATRRERGEKTYGCFVEGCDRKCSTPQKRRRHLIDKHMFPRTYNFYIVNDGIDKQNSMLRSAANTHRRRISAPTSPQEGRPRRRKASLTDSVPGPRGQGQNQAQAQPALSSSNGTAATATAEVDMMDLEKSMAALRFVPASVTRNRAKGNR
ncbi:conserved hypothetical protein [Paecilomyces variotii No. 5]|uniref:C2H2-type domain-containing protein n=1 Tax=Byssochlamys spectabilis (strain No. 5 / NBRC 109023) TaxID=1356009 RepID=V5I4K8_BYSSN|nr:conserved hypothetical protein [Paecilomyces variotii No. 5]